MSDKTIIYQKNNIIELSTHNIHHLQVDNHNEQIQISYYDKKGNHFKCYSIEYLESIGFINFKALENLL